MAFSLRYTPDLAAADASAEKNLAGKPYAKPSDLFAFRREFRLSMAQAAALLGYSNTWWDWKEKGYQRMTPEELQRARETAARVLEPTGRPMTLPQLTAYCRALEARIAKLEGRGRSLL